MIISLLPLDRLPTETTCPTDVELILEKRLNVIVEGSST